MRKKLCILYIIWLISGSILGLASIYISKYFIIPLIFTCVTIGCFAMSIRCPTCKKPVLKNKIKLFGYELIIWTSWMPKTCTQCSRKLK
jgi:hypothetical protein